VFKITIAGAGGGIHSKVEAKYLHRSPVIPFSGEKQYATPNGYD
jgi:hypothetical protein